MPTRNEPQDRKHQFQREWEQTPYPITGWPLAYLSWLDREGARGLVADLMLAGPLTRQAAYVVAACITSNGATAFLARLDITQVGAEGIGVALRRRRARDVIAAAYGVDSAEVPTGFLRAVSRIQEPGSEHPGLEPFERPESYRALFDILVGNRHGRRANALRYCKGMRSSYLDAVNGLDPVLVWPEVIDTIRTKEQVQRANALMALLRASISTHSDEDLVHAMRKSLSSRSVLETFARKAIERADRFPPPPIPAQNGIRPLMTATEYRDFGKAMGNCCGDKVAEALMGMIAIFEVKHHAEDGTEHILAVSLTPMVDGQWEVSDVKLARNVQPPEAVQRAVLGRFRSLGALVSGPALWGPYRADLSALLGIYRWGALDGCLRDLEQAEADALEELEVALGEVA